MARTRLLTTAGAFLTCLLLLAGCTGASNNNVQADEAGSGAFPVTVQHAFGSTTIEKKPQRVVTLGWMSQDIVAALSVVPVAVPESWGGDDEGFTPWFRTQVQDVLRGTMPQIVKFDDQSAPDFEQILALKPDLIYAPHSGFTDVVYKRLASIAPTVPHADKPWQSGTWQELTALTGKVLGEEDRARELVTTTQESIDKAKAEHPNLNGSSFVYTLAPSTDGGSELGFYVSGDPRVRLLHSFGLVDSPSLKALSSGSDEFNVAVSMEKLQDVDAKLVVAWSNDKESTARLLDQPLVSRWAPIASGRYYVLENKTLAMATNGPSPISIKWAIDQGFMSDLSKAIEGGKVIRPEA